MNQHEPSRPSEYFEAVEKATLSAKADYIASLVRGLIMDGSLTPGAALDALNPYLHHQAWRKLLQQGPSLPHPLPVAGPNPQNEAPDTPHPLAPN